MADTYKINSLLDENAVKLEKPSRYTCCGRRFPTGIFHGLVMLFVVIGGAGQQISLPIYLHTFGNGGGPYFVLWMCSFVFTIFFGTWALVLSRTNPHLITGKMLQLKWHPYMMLVGFMDSMNGFLAVYSSPLNRVSGPLQSVLSQALLAATIVASIIFLERVPNKWQMLAVVVMYGGAFVGLTPQFQRVADHTETIATQHWWWALVYFLAQVPAALMNVIQERMQDEFKTGRKYEIRLLPAVVSRALCRPVRRPSERCSSSGAAPHHPLLGDSSFPSREASHQREFSVIYFQFVESAYQWMFMTAFFWFDMLPNYGFSTNISDFWTSYSFGWQCFFNVKSTEALSDICDYSAPLATLFMLLYITSYVSGTLATRHLSANLSACCSALCPVIAMIFWFAFPSVNAWAGGTPFALGSRDGIFNIAAMVIILAGVMWFRMQEDDKGEAQALLMGSNLSHGGDEPIELIWPDASHVSQGVRASTEGSLQQA